MKSMTPRQSKVANQIQHICAMALVQGRIPSTLPLARLTVTDGWVSPDLRVARLYLQVPAEHNNAEFFAEANAQLGKGLRKALAEGLATKYTPNVTLFPAEDEKSYPAPQKDIMK